MKTVQQKRSARNKSTNVQRPASLRERLAKRHAAIFSFVPLIEALATKATKKADEDIVFGSVATMLHSVVRILHAYDAGEAEGMKVHLWWSDNPLERHVLGQRLELTIAQVGSDFTAEERKTMLDIEQARDEREHAAWLRHVRETGERAVRQPDAKQHAKNLRRSREWGLAADRVSKLERELAEARKAEEVARKKERGEKAVKS